MKLNVDDPQPVKKVLLHIDRIEDRLMIWEANNPNADGAAGGTGGRAVSASQQHHDMQTMIIRQNNMETQMN